MKRSIRSFAKKASNLYPSIYQQLSVYAVAAVVALVSVLALAQPSEAKIVYTPADVVIMCHISCNPPYNLDLNHDGVADFIFTVSSDFRFGFCGGRAEADELPIGGNAVVGAPLKKGAQIGRGQDFGGGEEVMAWVKQVDYNNHCYSSFGGPWYGVIDRFLGVEFKKNGKTHYGWARLSVGPAFINLTGCAYETIPGKSIKAGQKKEAADDFTNEDLGPGASLTSPIPDKPRPASLGILALGSQGVPLWRRKESALEGNLTEA
jgi:hypothetical protein